MDDTTKLQPGDYTIKWPTGCKYVGTYEPTITLKGNYAGTNTVSYKINPRATKWKSLIARRKGFTARWTKRVSQTTGYQLQYSTSRSFKTYKNVWIKNNSTTKKTVTKLKARKKYYVRIRTYKIKNNKKYYSAWTAKRSIKTRK